MKPALDVWTSAKTIMDALVVMIDVVSFAHQMHTTLMHTKIEQPMKTNVIVFSMHYLQ